MIYLGLCQKSVNAITTCFFNRNKDFIASWIKKVWEGWVILQSRMKKGAKESPKTAKQEAKISKLAVLCPAKESANWLAKHGNPTKEYPSIEEKYEILCNKKSNFPGPLFLWQMQAIIIAESPFTLICLNPKCKPKSNLPSSYKASTK